MQYVNLSNCLASSSHIIGRLGVRPARAHHSLKSTIIVVTAFDREIYYTAKLFPLTANIFSPFCTKGPTKNF